MTDGKRGRPPLPEGWKRIYFNVSPEDLHYINLVEGAQSLATRGDVLRLIVSDARTNNRFLNGNDANIATEPQS